MHLRRQAFSERARSLLTGEPLSRLAVHDQAGTGSARDQVAVCADAEDTGIRGLGQTVDVGPCTGMASTVLVRGIW